MAILPDWCERCAEFEVNPKLGTVREDGRILCDGCSDSESEAAYERFLEDFYGGSGPVTIDEHYQKAAKEKADLRRRH